MEQDWSNIPLDIGHVILCKLPELLDHVWFGSVCKNWNHIAKEYHQFIRPSRGTLPMLFIPSKQCDTQRMFYSMSYSKLFPNVTLSDIPYRRCCGSSNGWLAFMEEDFSVTLINPFISGLDNTIHLPVLKLKSIDRVPRYDDAILKLILSPDSTRENYTAVALYGGMCQLATVRSGDSHWTYIKGKNQIVRRMVTLTDILFHKGLVYAISHDFKIFSIDVNSRPPRVKTLKQRESFPVVEERYIHTYIVESTSGDLYVLRRKRDAYHPHFFTTRFKVVKLELHPKSGKVVRFAESKTLDGDCIFMSESFIAVVKADEFDWCKSNSIYYTDDQGGHDLRPTKREDSGIYNIEEGDISRLYLRDPKDRRKRKPTAVWVQLQPV